MKRKSAAERLVKKRAAWIERTSAALGMPPDKAAILLSVERRQSLRVNPLAGDRHGTVASLGELGWKGRQFDWYTDGYTLETPLESIRDSELVASGKVYIQNAASWLPVLALDPQKGEDILDVCAAPGGKTSHIAAATANQARIVANDNSRSRLMKLRATMERLNASAEYTLYDATTLAAKMNGRLFDKILLDAPCSGEGMMRLDRDADFDTWSAAHIKRLQQLQKRLITQAWQLLRVGGTLVYSTCTMAPEENEAVIDYLLRNRDDAIVQQLSISLANRVPAVREWNGRHFDPALSECMRLAPSEQVEAFFVCKLQKVARPDMPVL